MTKYSRTSKYEELRNKLQNDAEEEIRSRELSSFEARLNQINSSNFENKGEYNAEDHDPLHARHQQYLQNAQAQEPSFREPSRPLDYGLQNSLFGKNENYNSSFNNEYLDEYLNEVKQYNIDNGNAFSTDTDLNILQSLKGQPEPKKPVAPSKPYPATTTQNTMNYIPTVNPPRPQQAVKEEKKRNDTTDLLFFPPKEKDPFEEYINNKQEAAPRPANTATMTREDIAAEVKNLINQQEEPVVSTGKTKENAVEKKDSGYDTRQQLLNETTQMRAQLDDYEDNLTAVSDRMQKTNRILNGVLIVFIITLSIMLLIVLYWILNARGIL